MASQYDLDFSNDPYARYLASGRQGSQLFSSLAGSPPSVPGSMTMAGSTMGPVGTAVGIGLDVADLGLRTYSAYKGAEERKRALREERRRYEDQKRAEREMFEYRKYLDKLAGQFQAGEYGQNLADRAMQQGLRFAS